MHPREPRSRTPSLAAVIDLGTNAARLALASLSPDGRLVPRGRWRELIRLGEGLAASGELSPAAISRGLACMQRFAAIVRERGVDALDAVATSALREAANREAFLTRARQLGVPLRVIGADEEARLALAGVMAGLAHPPGRALVVDIGGGSVELILAREGRLAEVASLPAGVVRLTERHLRHMPARDEELRGCAEEVRELLVEVSFLGRTGGVFPLIGCGGTVALAWFIKEGRPEGGGIDGAELAAGEVDRWVDRFAALDRGERGRLEGFEAGREDVALAGLIVLRELFRRTGRATLRVSTGGIREGRLLELLEGIRDG